MSDQGSRASAQLFFAQDLAQLRAKQSQHQRSLDNAIQLCINEAWLAWLNELFLLVSAKGQTAQNIRSLDELVALVGASHPEVQRLKNISSSPSSWLAHILRGPQQVQTGRAKVQHVEADVKASAGLIPMASIDAEPDTMTHEQIIADFKAYINEVRAHLTEW